MMRVERTRKIRISLLATVLCTCFFLLAPIWPAPAKAEPDAKAALARLESEEANLPPAARPEPDMGAASRHSGAQAFFLAGLSCHDIMRRYAEPLSKKAFGYFKASLAYEESPLVRAYLGSSHLIAARDAKSAIAKVKEVDEGLREVDAAVKAAPADIGVRAVRIESTIELPAMFKRLDTVTADIDFLLDRYLKDKSSLGEAYSPASLFAMKARELELRGKNSLAAKYRQKAEELNAAKADSSKAAKEKK
jgi:hypothetical protein